MFVMSVERKNVVSSLFGCQTLQQAFTCSGNVFFCFRDIHVRRADHPEHQPWKTHEVTHHQQKIEHIEIFEIFCFILKIFVRHTFLHTFYTL